MRSFERRLGAVGLAFILLAGLSAPALAQAANDVHFGDDSSQWAKDGECDDPRFEGTGMATELEDVDREKDATDCKALFEAGSIKLKAEGTSTSAPATTTTKPDATSAEAVDFGDDSSHWAKDGECDDPRFEGTGMAEELEEADLKKDATDCRALFEAGSISLKSDDSDTAASAADAAATAADIDFGDDSSEWAKDGECDDPRFQGTGMAEDLLDTDRKRDATDCRTAFEAGQITLKSGDSVNVTPIGEIDFGDDSSEWAKDQECDDPRFVGSAMAEDLDGDNTKKDASDCRQAYEDGTIHLIGEAPAVVDTPAQSSAALEAIAGRIDFGDDSGEYPNDGECDDPDFVGTGASYDPSDANRLKDATDCRAAFVAGSVTFKSSSANTNVSASGFNYGGDTSEWANDGQCDDPRFEGAGMAKKLSGDDEMGDATDCQTLEQQGEVSIKPVYQPEYAQGGPYDASAIDFGDNSSEYANDDQCDDPRFEGPGAAVTLLDSDLKADAADCRAAFEAGTVVLRAGQS